MVRALTEELVRLVPNHTNSTAINSTEKNSTNYRRPRSLTTLKLEVVAERARKMKRIKESLAAGSYKVDQRDVAVALMKNFSEDDLK